MNSQLSLKKPELTWFTAFPVPGALSSALLPTLATETHLHCLVFVATSNAAFVSGGSVGPEKADAQQHQVVSWQLSKQPQETRDIYSVTAQHTDSPLSHLKTAPARGLLLATVP